MEEKNLTTQVVIYRNTQPEDGRQLKFPQNSRGDFVDPDVIDESGTYAPYGACIDDGSVIIPRDSEGLPIV